MAFCGTIKADTAVIVTIGPFVDVGDGFTPQIDITLGGDEAELLKHGSDTVVDISTRTWAVVANCRGYYSLTLTTDDTDTEGMITVIVQDDSDCLPVRCSFQVVNDNGVLSGVEKKLMIDRLYSRHNHEVNVTDSTGAIAIRNAADNADIATGTITDDDTTTSQSAISWS